MAQDISVVVPTAKARAKLVFAKIDEGADPTKIRQHKLRQAQPKRLVYKWHAHSDKAKCNKTPHGFKATLEVRRDSLNRLYVKELPSMPAEAEQAYNELKAHPDQMIWVTDEV